MPEIKTEQDAFCVQSTQEHRNLVNELCRVFAALIQVRGKTHDASKLEDPEFPLFSEVTPKLAKLTYGSDEYKFMLEKIRPALDHHYANNRHHPESHKNGIRDMNLVDIVEMFIDWYAATKRHNDGNIRRSIDINKERFNFSEDLAQIFINTIELFDE